MLYILLLCKALCVTLVYEMCYTKEAALPCLFWATVEQYGRLNIDAPKSHALDLYMCFYVNTHFSKAN